VIRNPESVKKIGTPYHIYGMSTGEKCARRVMMTASALNEFSSGRYWSEPSDADWSFKDIVLKGL
jgi:hypothetical protein